MPLAIAPLPSSHHNGVRLFSSLLMASAGELLLISTLIATVTVATPQQRLAADILKNYDKRVKPTRNASTAINVTFRLTLYQITEVNEPGQFVSLNVWVSETWQDELLYWDPSDYGNITSLTLPHDSVWKPDTTLYNLLVMNDVETRRLLNLKLDTKPEQHSVTVTMLYPALFTFSCQMKLMTFPFDRQNCTLTFGSWTYDAANLDYFPNSEQVEMHNYIENEGWSVIEFTAVRRQRWYTCCPHPWTNLYFSLRIQRKALFYVVNLIIPTSIITLISIVGFFVPASADGERHEKITLGITTLLSMSILLLMVSDQMPTTSTFIPLIGRFYLCMIALISSGTIMSTVIISVQTRGLTGSRLSTRTIALLRCLSATIAVRVPDHVTFAAELARHSTKTKKERSAPDGICSEETVYKLAERKQNTVSTEPLVSEMSGDANGAASFLRPTPLHLLTAPMSRRHNLQLAILEHQWLASVIERLSLIVFLLLLVFGGGGILAYGALLGD